MIILKNFQDLSFPFKDKELSLFINENKEKEEQNWNPSKNPYLNKVDVPEIEIIDKNKIIFCNKKKYKIKEYVEKINNTINSFLDDNIYNYCGKCHKYLNKFFCLICHKNICEDCYKECNLNKHSTQNLDNDNYKNNICKIKLILNNLIIPINKDEKIIQNIIEYLDKYIINNDIISKEFSLGDNNIKNEDILLIYQIISKDYINYFHYRNIEIIFHYLRKEYYKDSNNKYEGFGKIIFENGEYYIGEFKNGLRNGKGILFYKNERLIDFGDFVGDIFLGCGKIQCQIYNYYIGEWKEGLRHGKGLLSYKNGKNI